MGATCAMRRLRMPDVFNLKKEEREMEATHVADWKATYLYVYVQSLYLYVNLVKCKCTLPCLIIP